MCFWLGKSQWVWYCGSVPLDHRYWIRDSVLFPGHAEYMEIMPEKGMILCPALVHIDPPKYLPLAMSYVDAGEGHVRTRLRPDEPWREHRYRIEGDVILWDHQEGIREWPWNRMAEEEWPEWYPEFRDNAVTRFEEKLRQAVSNGG